MVGGGGGSNVEEGKLFDRYFVAARMDIDVDELQLFHPRPPVSRNLHKFAQLRRGLVRLGA